jgi:hypothetical protein
MQPPRRPGTGFDMCTSVQLFRQSRCIPIADDVDSQLKHPCSATKRLLFSPAGRGAAKFSRGEAVTLLTMELDRVERLVEELKPIQKWDAA